MVNKNFNLLFFVLVVQIYSSCGISKEKSSPKISKCDSIANLLLKNPDQFRLTISNVNSTTSIQPIHREDQTVYEFQFTGNPIFDKYELIFQARREDGSITKPFTIAVNVTDRFSVSIYGDRLTSIFVKLDDLAAKCLNPENKFESAYDCVYHSDWKVSIRGIVCDYHSPISDQIRFSVMCQ